MGLPAAMIGSAGIGAAGSFLSSRASGPKTTAVPKPTALFPGMQESYMKDLTAAGIGPTSFGTLGEMARTGSPTDVGPAFEAMKSSMGRLHDEGRANVIEKFGVAGLRHSSDIDRAAVDFESQNAKDFASILADYTRQSSEAAAGRRLAASVTGIQTQGELATAFTPTAVVTGGGPSPAGTALSSVSSGINNFLMMKALFPHLFKSAGTA